MECTVQKRTIRMKLVAKTPFHDIIDNPDNLILDTDRYDCVAIFLYNNEYYARTLHLSGKDYIRLHVEYEYDVLIHCVFIEPNKAPRIIISNIEIPSRG